jgi:hypothetical protein
MQYRTACADGQLVRLQSSWAHDTLFGWGLLKSVSPRGHPLDVVTQEAMHEAGCGHMTKVAYIETYCMEKTIDGDKCVASEVVVVSFARLWTREAKAVVCAW